MVCVQGVYDVQDRLPYAPEFRRQLVEQVQVGLRRENLVRSGDLS